MNTQKIRSTIDEMVVAALELVNDFDATDEAAIDEVTAMRPELRSLVAQCFDEQSGSECLSDDAIVSAVSNIGAHVVTPKAAQLMAIAAARFAYRDWDGNEEMDEAVLRGEYRLNEILASYGLTNGKHDRLLDWIDEAYLDAVSNLFGGPSIR